MFRRLNRTHPDDEAKRLWKSIQVNLSKRKLRTEIDTFFRHYWLSKYTNTTESKIYKDFKKQVGSPDFDPKQFLQELQRESQTYDSIVNPLIGDWARQEDRPVFESLQALSLFQISQVRTVLLAIMVQRNASNIAYKDFRKSITNIENFHFRYNAICSLRTNVLESKYSTTARNLRKCTSKDDSKEVLNELTDFLKSKLPGKDLFIDSFDALEYAKHKKIIRYIFNKIEKYLRTTHELNTNIITLEHIAPQSNSSIPNRNKIGNLLPLDQSLNEIASNKSFMEKIPILRQSELKVVQDFLSNYGNRNSWDRQDIEERTQNLAEYCYDCLWLIN